jgi:hypothetical protein
MTKDEIIEMAKKREFVGLTDEEINKIVVAYWGEMKGGPLVMNRKYARAIEAKLKEKNSG